MNSVQFTTNAAKINFAMTYLTKVVQYKTGSRLDQARKNRRSIKTSLRTGQDP